MVSTCGQVIAPQLTEACAGVIAEDEQKFEEVLEKRVPEPSIFVVAPESPS